MSDSETDLCAGLSMDKDEMFLKPARKTRQKMSKSRRRGRCDDLCHLHRGTTKGMQFGMAAAQIDLLNIVSLKWWSNHEYIGG